MSYYFSEELLYYWGATALFYWGATILLRSYYFTEELLFYWGATIFSRTSPFAQQRFPPGCWADSNLEPSLWQAGLLPAWLILSRYLATPYPTMTCETTKALRSQKKIWQLWVLPYRIYLAFKKTSYLKNEAAHIRDFGCLLLETLEEVLRQDEVSLLPSAEVNICRLKRL